MFGVAAKKRLRRLGLILGVLGAAFSISAFAATNNVIRYAVDPFPPWVIVQEETATTGIDIIIGRYIADELNLNADFIVCPFARCLRLLETGAADAMLNLFHTPEREQYIAYISPHLTSNPPKVFYLRASSEADVVKYSDLQKMIVGYVRATAYFEPFDSDNSINKVPLNSDIGMIEMLIAGRIDTFISTENVVNYWLSLGGYSGQIKKATFTYASDRLTYMGISRLSPLMSRFDEVENIASEMETSNTVDQLIESFWSQQRELNDLKVEN